MIDDIGPASNSFISQRLRLHYLDWGNADAPTLVLVHGGRDHARSWDWVARELRHDWHVICPDLRGHGDSAWSPDAAYLIPYLVYDLAQLVHQQGKAPVSIVAHSLGAAVSLRYTGLFPETVRRLVSIEGTGLPSRSKGDGESDIERMRTWIGNRRASAARTPRRYASIDEALQRMREENRHLSEAQARHLTIHGVNRNEDGSYSWKFDNYVRNIAPFDLATGQHDIWGAIRCPTLLLHGRDSFAISPEQEDILGYFQDVRSVGFDDAGHWLHHDRFDAFMAELKAFL